MSAEMMVRQRSLFGRDRRSVKAELEAARRSVASLMAEAQALAGDTLELVGYDKRNRRRVTGRPGRPPKTGITLRERHETVLRGMDIQKACEATALAIDRMADFQEEDALSRSELCRELMAEASEIAGEDPLPAEQILAITIVVARELSEITDRCREILGTSLRTGTNPATAERMLERLRERLGRIV